jgi:hypothetical protein
MTQQRRILPALILLVVLLFVSAILGPRGDAQTGQSPQGQSFSNKQVTYTPTQLGVNALTLPSSSTTADSTIINSPAITEMTLLVTCTQNYSINVKVFAEDGTTAFQSYALVTGITANTNVALFIGNETPHAATSGTAAQAMRLPQRALSFSFTNASASAGTCTARLITTY